MIDLNGVKLLNAVRALSLDPKTGRPHLKNRYGSLSGRAIKPIELRAVAELRDDGIRLPIIATAGVQSFDDCHEYFWAGADAVSLGSAVWLAQWWGYLLGPLRGLAIRRLIRQVQALEPNLHGRSGHPSRDAERPLEGRAEDPVLPVGAER